MAEKSYTEIFNARGHLYNSATALCPKARDEELNELLALINFKEGQVVCDAPAGGGYVAEGIYHREGNKVKVVCVEPSEPFSEAISPRFHILNQPLYNTLVDDHYFDVIASLAGLHHAEDKQSIFNEWSRTLKPKGALAVADVAEGSGAAAFLNVYVDKHNPQGHKGLFFNQDDFSSLMDVAGITPLSDHLVEVPWVFDSREQMAAFCRMLFGIESATNAEVAVALQDYVGVREDAGEVKLLWSLQYAKGEKG